MKIHNINITDIKKHVHEDFFTNKNKINFFKLYRDLKNINMPFDEFKVFYNTEGTKDYYKFQAAFKVIKVLEKEVTVSIITTLCTKGEDFDFFNFNFIILESGILKLETINNENVDIPVVFYDYLLGEERRKNSIKHPYEYSESHFNICIQNLYYCFFAISIMNCNNVSIEVDPNTKLSSKIRRKIKRGHQKPLTKYHILNIRPFKSKSTSKNNIVDNESKISFHMCRGHFKTYGGKGLFGKYKGTFWFPAHVKGSKEIGEVTKDYEVKV